jgi:hypothetical protein
MDDDDDATPCRDSRTVREGGKKAVHSRRSNGQIGQGSFSAT